MYRSVYGTFSAARRSLAPFLFAALGVATAASCGAGDDPGGTSDRPNVLLITLDTTRADHFGSLGHPGRTTPSFDALAHDGALFRRAVATAAVTPVSHASILTGLNPYHHGLRVLSAASGYRLPVEVPSLATLFAARGWRTGAVHSAFPVSAHFGLDQGFEHFDSFDAEVQVEGQAHSWDVGTYQRRSDATTDRAIAYLDGGAEPFFLWVHYWDPHDPSLLPPEEYLEGVPPGGRSPAMYAAEIRYMDAQFGRLLAALEERGLASNTIVAVTSDHGEGLGEHDWIFHRLLYQEQIHVPLILRGPGVPAGVEIDTLVSTVDLAPTLLELAGLPVPSGLDGRSLVPALEGRVLPERVVYADQINGYDQNSKLFRKRPLDDFLYCVIEDPWKLIYRPRHPNLGELYDLASDPEEARNRYAEEHAVRTRLLKELARRAPWVTAPFPDRGEGLDAGASRALEALGYAEGSVEEAPVGEAWQWFCVDHADALLDEAGTCPVCGEPLLLRRRGD